VHRGGHDDVAQAAAELRDPVAGDKEEDDPDPRHTEPVPPIRHKRNKDLAPGYQVPEVGGEEE
jgi:hypothetical protein